MPAVHPETKSVLVRRTLIFKRYRKLGVNWFHERVDMASRTEFSQSRFGYALLAEVLLVMAS